ncbi:HAD family hydrolase [Cupriavidus campinensis]
MTRIVVFDAFGTLVELAERRSPYRNLLKWMHENGHRPHPADAARIMSMPLGLPQTAKLFGMNPPVERLAAWDAELQAELRSVRLFPDVSSTITRLREANYRIGLCSNLAAPYCAPVIALLPSLDAYAWSCEVGAVKPDPAIYQYIVNQLNCAARDVLFVGDTPGADVEGPRAFGMNAKLINRKKGQTLDDVLGDLY